MLLLPITLLCLGAATPRPGLRSPQMTPQAIEAFLNRPLIARLATVRADHSPQLTPMWYLWEGGALYMSTRASSAKVKHIRSNPRVAVVVDIMEAPRKNIIVTIEGRAEVLTEKVAEWTAKIRRRYMPASADLHPQDPEPRVILKITPRKVEGIDTTK
jgi:PPOX class probable F420-dependent enzyme